MCRDVAGERVIDDGNNTYPSTLPSIYEVFFFYDVLNDELFLMMMLVPTSALSCCDRLSQSCSEINGLIGEGNIMSPFPIHVAPASTIQTIHSPAGQRIHLLSLFSHTYDNTASHR